MVYFKHEDWRQNDEDEVKCKPGQIQPLISKEIGRLLFDIRILIWPLKNGIAELLVSNKDDHRCHVGIENDCLHEDPEIEGTTWLLTHFMSNTTTTALEWEDKGPLGLENCSLVYEDTSSVKCLSNNPLASVSIKDSVGVLFTFSSFLTIVLIFDMCAHVEDKRYHSKNKDCEMGPALNLEWEDNA